jgi:protein ImuB
MFAALHLPDLTALAVLRGRPELRCLPYAVIELAGHAVVEKVKLPLLAVNGLARGTGIDAGWPLNRALVRCPDLTVLPPDPAGEAALLGEMVAAAESLTADLEIASRDTLLLDLSRCTSRQAAGLDWLELAEGEPRWVKADTPDLALLAVRHPACHGRHMAPADLAPLPLGLLGRLPGGAEMLPLLDDWGLRHLGDLMALPRQALAERLGPAAGAWHDLLHGKSSRLLRLHRPPESLAQSLDFEQPLVQAEALVFAFKRLLHALAGRLAARHLAVKSLRLSFQLDGGSSVTRLLRLPEPRVAAEDLLRPVQVLLDAWKADAAIVSIGLDAETTAPTAAQRDWFIRQLPRPQQWTDTLARLEGLLGSGRTGIPVPPDSHRPDDFRLLPGDRPPAVAAENAGFPECPVPLRRFRPPLGIAVAHDAGPRPLALLTGPYRGEIVASRGPFRRSGGWWDPQQSWQRLEWDVQLAGQQILRLVYLPPDQWQVDGVYQG